MNKRISFGWVWFYVIADTLVLFISIAFSGLLWRISEIFSSSTLLLLIFLILSLRGRYTWTGPGLFSRAVERAIAWLGDCE